MWVQRDQAAWRTVVGLEGRRCIHEMRNAAVCAYSALPGMTGPSYIFEGEMGFIAPVTGLIDIEPADVGKRASHDFRIRLAKTKMCLTSGEMQTAVSAQFEHTVAVTRHGVQVLTLQAGESVPH
nr:hypothetical protein [Pseudacidovorax sp.]